jgi:hypothetical protein
MKWEVLEIDRQFREKFNVRTTFGDKLGLAKQTLHFLK